MINKIFFVFAVLFLSVSSVSAFIEVGEDTVQYCDKLCDDNLFVYNEGSVPYHIFNDVKYLGSINPGQGMPLDETNDYRIYAGYNSFRDFENPGFVEEKFNQWWAVIFILLLIGLIFIGVARKVLW